MIESGQFNHPNGGCHALLVSMLCCHQSVQEIVRRIRKLKLNPLKDQIYTDTKAYQRIVEEIK